MIRQAWYSVNSRERTFGIIAFTWIVMIGLSFAWNWHQVGKSAIMFAESDARASYDKDLVYRRWSALQGGVYVPPTEIVPPNPYLSHLPERDIVTTGGKQLTLVNPAYMTRMVHALGKEQYGIQGHITSLNPLNPHNAADPWETEALRLFAAGSKQVVSREMINGNLHLRFMRPLVTEKPCLKCHASQGYQEGDVRGGISVSVPFLPYEVAAEQQWRQLLFAHLLIGGLGLLGLWQGNALLRSSETTISRGVERHKNILNTSMDGFLIVNSQGRLLEVNQTYCLMSGYSEKVLLAMHIADLAVGKMDDEINTHIQKIMEQGEERFESKHRRMDGSIFDVEISAQYEPIGDGQFTVFLRDITLRNQMMTALHFSLAEKDVLLREVHHRVKNNMAAIIGLFDLQRLAMDEPKAQTAMSELSSRVRAMSLVHEKLYRSESLSEIDFQDYLQSLIPHLHTSFGSPSIICEIEAQGVKMPLDLAVPCGMIINELITNTLKYAFPKDRKEVQSEVDHIVITMSHDSDIFILSVADNGIGLPPGFDLNTAETLGLSLVRMLGQHQLGGRYEVDKIDGTRFTLTFSMSKRKESHA